VFNCIGQVPVRLGQVIVNVIMIKLQSIEPFLTYPESIIDSEEKSLKVIKQNYYYFIVMGCFLVTLGCIIFIGESQNR